MILKADHVSFTGGHIGVCITSNMAPTDCKIFFVTWLQVKNCLGFGRYIFAAALFKSDIVSYKLYIYQISCLTAVTWHVLAALN